MVFLYQNLLIQIQNIFTDFESCLTFNCVSNEFMTFELNTEKFIERTFSRFLNIGFSMKFWKFFVIFFVFFPFDKLLFPLKHLNAEWFKTQTIIYDELQFMKPQNKIYGTFKQIWNYFIRKIEWNKFILSFLLC